MWKRRHLVRLCGALCVIVRRSAAESFLNGLDAFFGGGFFVGIGEENGRDAAFYL